MNLGDYDQSSPLHYAAKANQLEAARYLLENAKVSVNKRDRWAATALDYSVNNTGMASLLRAFGGVKSKSIPYSNP